MKNVITYLKALWRRGLGSQSSDVSLDCRLTVGSPSVKCGSTLMRLVAVVAILLTMGVGNVWGDTGTLVSKLSDISDGSTYYIAALNSSKYYTVPNTTISGQTFTCSEGSLSGSTLTPATGAGEFVFTAKTGTANAYYIYNTNLSKYLVATGSKTFGYVDSNSSDYGYWTFSTVSSGGFSGVFSVQHSFKTHYMRAYRNSVRCYDGASNNGVYLFEKGSACSGTKLGSPSEIDAVPSSSQVVLSWPVVANASSYTVTCKNTSSGASAGTVGSVTGDGPKTCTITGLSAGTSYTFSVIAKGDGTTWCDGDATEVVAIAGNSYSVTWMVNGASFKTTYLYTGGTKNLVFPTAPSSCDAEKVFVGWTETNIGSSETDTPPTLVTSATTISANKTYYAVFAKRGAFTRVTGPSSLAAGQELVIVSNKYSTAITTGIGYASAPTESSSTLTDATTTEAMVWLLTGGSSSGWFISNPSNGYVLGYASNPSSNNSTAATLAPNNTKSTWTIGQNSNTSNVLYISNKNTNSCALEASSASANWVVYNSSSYNSNPYCALRVYASTLTKFVTQCCTSLASINGSVSWSNAATAVVSWDNLDHVSSWTVKYKTHAAGAYTTWAGDQSTAAGRRSVTITGLTPCTNYDFQIIANPASGYCDKDQTIEDSQTHNWTVTKTGVTNVTAASLSAIPATTCASGFGPITITAATGYALPADITVTNASKSWNSSTGALSISSVTGNVSITITPTCVSPVVTADPEDADYYVGDAPTALSVTATLASGTRTYLWKVSTNGGSTWSDASGTNNAATYSGASLSTASAGTLKFKCIVGNSEGGCTVESEVATITVAEPSSWKFKYSGDSWEEHTMIEDAGVASYSISLDADSRFEFCFAGGSVYKNSGTMITTTSGWTFNTSDNNCKIHTGPAGTYTFAINTSTKSVTVTYPTVSHPNEHYVYFKNTNVWGTVYGYLANSENDNKAAAWPGSVMAATTTICGETYHYAALNAMSGTYNTIIFNNGNSGYGNQTSDLSTTGSLGKYNANSDAAWHQFKYAIRFDKGTGSGDAMSSIENLCPESDQALTANTYTKEHHTFAGWIADVDVKVGESTIDAGEIIDDEVTIKDIQSDINLTAQWTPNTYTITKTLTNVANVGLPASFTYTGATTTALNSTFTVDATNFFLPSSIAVTMGGTPLTAGTDYTYNNSTGAFTFDRIISGNIVITASATAKLKSIAITTQPTTRKYFAGESFSSAGAVVTATMGDGSTKTVSETWDLTTLTAGAGQTVTASYSEGGIDQTATTTIDVYSVTVNKKNEDGDAIDVAGVTATWTVGSKTIAASVGSTKYVFKQWDVTGATAASTSSASTTLSSPTANVVVNAIFYKPRVVKWSVNGNDSYASSETVAYNGTISAVPTAPADNTLSCTNKFMGWSTKDAGTTPKTTSYYDDLFTNASGYTTNITAATTTFYAVFAEATTGTKYLTNSEQQAQYCATNDCTPKTNTYANSPYTISSDGGDWRLVGLFAKNVDTYYSQIGNGSVTIAGNSERHHLESPVYPDNITKITVVATQGANANKTLYFCDGVQADPSTNNIGTLSIAKDNTTPQELTPSSAVTSFYIYADGTTQINTITVIYGSASNYVTECDANIVSVTYDANGGATSCANTTTDKTEDYTVCSSAPTRDYYTFAGWLCSADDEVYAASATISAAVIDADFTLTAQWTPVPYNITYELDGGTNNVGNPATYNVTTATITLQNPTKGHDRFEGWYDNSSFTGDAITSIPVGSHGDITLYAKWAERHEIIFDADGTKTTIYRADDENLEDAVAGQGSVPSDPDAPTACSSKTFVGWSESEIDEETDTRPGDLMKSAAGTVDEDKHYYAVWATVTPTDPPATYAGTGVFEEITSMEDFETGTYYVLYGYDGESTHGALKNAGSGTAGEEAGTNMTVSTSSITNPSTDIVWKLGGTTDAYTLYNQSASKYIEITTDDAKGFALNASATTSYKVTVEDGHGFFFKTNKTGCTRGISIYTSTSFRCYALANAKNLRLFKLPTNTVTAYCTSCCGTKVTLSENSPEHGTIVFGKTSVGTCGGDKEVSLTITPAAGYQLHSYEVATGSGKVAAKSVSPDIALDNNSSAEQNITLTFAEDANGAYDVTASFTKMAPTAWTWTYKSEAIPNPINLYVGQTATLNATYTPSGLLNSEQNYDVTKSANLTQTSKTYASPDIHYTFRADAAMDDGTVTLTNQINTSLTTTVHVHVDPLPRVHFEDLVHGKEFADVVATLSENALNPNKTTKTSVDWVTPNANTCEENHLHLVGWIRSDWPALVAYLNGTGDAPTTTAIVGAGNDGSGNAYFFAPNASINVLTFNGATFYAVWAEIK